MTNGVPPGTKAANEAALSMVEERLRRLDRVEKSLDAKLSDPAYSTALQQAALAAGKRDIQNARAVLERERVLRTELASAFDPLEDKTASKAALDRLNEHRKKAYPAYYVKGARVGDPCIPCLQRKVDNVKRALQPVNDEQMAETVTGIFEGGQPDYCALADHPDDLGKLSYGKHQASETSGSLKQMLDRYSALTDPKPDPTIKAQVDTHRAKFHANGRSYDGTDAERSQFRAALKKACKDPAMQRAQEAHFKQNYFDPALQKANKYGVTSPLGKSMYYDMEIQGSALVDGFSKRALEKWSDSQDLSPPATACKPQDLKGPSEKEFLYLVNAERRTTMQNSSNDLYKATIYRPDSFDRLLDQGNMNMDKDFNLRGQHVKGMPSMTTSGALP